MLQQIINFATSSEGVALAMAVIGLVTRILEKAHLRKKGLLHDKPTNRPFTVIK